MFHLSCRGMGFLYTESVCICIFLEGETSLRCFFYDSMFKTLMSQHVGHAQRMDFAIIREFDDI